MKAIIRTLLLSALLLAVGLLPVAMFAGENQGHHQSGIVGQVNGGLAVGTPTGEGSYIVPDHVRIYQGGKLVAEVETEVADGALWHFEVNLKPGDYELVAYGDAPPENGGILVSYPVAVTVEKKTFTEVTLTFPPV